MMAEMAAIAGVRVTLIGADGRVRGDSSGDYRIMENHADRPEVREALAGETGRSRRFSRTLGADLLYVAVPLRREGTIAGVMRVSRAQREVATAIGRMRRTFILGALVTIIPALLVGLAIVNRATRPLLALERAARQLGAGDFNTRVREFGQDELGVLARTFNRMANQLNRLVTALSEESGKLRTVLAALADGIIVFDRHQRVLLANRAAAEFLGTAPAKMAGCSPAELLLPPAAIELVARAVKARSETEGEFEVHLPVRRQLAAALTPIRDAELRLHGTLVVLRDLTKLRHLERVRQDFVANVSHELRTPLAAIKVMTETLLQEGLSADQSHKFLASIDAECDRLNALVGDLLILTELDDVTDMPQAEIFSLHDLVSETAARMFPEEGGRRPALSVPPGLPPVKAGRDQIRQVLINLLDNAVKYSSPEARFGVSADYDASWVTVTVWDEGPGVPPAERARIFERFYRIDKARSRALGGTGLGLSIVKHIVEGYGGRVWEDGTEGAAFHFTVPRG